MSIKSSKENNSQHNLQDVFLNYMRKNKIPTTIFLVNGIKLQGIITWFDNFCLLIKRDNCTQMIYKHSVATIVPNRPVSLFDETLASSDEEETKDEDEDEDE